MIEEGQLYGPLRGNGVTREGMSIVPNVPPWQNSVADEPQWTPEEAAAIRQIESLTVVSDICICKQVVEVKSAGGLILPGEEKKQRVGRVLAAGPGRTYENGITVPNPFKAGDSVVFGKYASGGESLWFKQLEFLLFRANDVIGKLPPGVTSLD